MNRSTLLLLIIFLVLGGLTTWYFLQGETDQTTLLGEDRRFAVDPDRIGRIFIADRYGQQTLLERQGYHWQVNGKYLAYDNAVDNLLDAISRIEMAYKPAEAAVPNMVNSLSTQGLKVEIYDRQGENIMTYYLGGTTQDERGTFIIRDGYDQPYVAHLPGWDGNLRHRYSLIGDQWRDKAVFRAELSDIASLSVDYPQQRSQSFRILRTDNDWAVLPVYETTPPIERPLQQGAVESYLTEYEAIFAETFQNENPQRDSLQDVLPFTIIRLEKSDGSIQEARFYPRYPRTDIDPETGRPIPTQNEVQRYNVLTKEGDMMVVQSYVFQRLFRPYHFFFQP